MACWVSSPLTVCVSCQQIRADRGQQVASLSDLLMEGSMFTAALPLWRWGRTPADTEASPPHSGPIWLPSAWIARLQFDYSLSLFSLFVCCSCLAVSVSFSSFSQTFNSVAFLPLTLTLCKTVLFLSFSFCFVIHLCGFHWVVLPSISKEKAA